MSGQIDDLTLITEPVRERLNERQLVDYRAHRKQMLSWLLNFGKNPDRAEGYAYDTVHRSSYRIDQLYRWVWDERGYTTQISTDDGDEYLQKLAYDDTDALWLTRYSNPYQSASLGSLLKDLRDIGEIPPDGRDLSWYSIRHSTGTYMTHHEDLGAARDQLRHKSKMTTLKYDHAPIEQRQQALNRMG